MGNVTELDVVQAETLQAHGFEPMNEAVWTAWLAKNELQEKNGVTSRFKIIKYLCIGVLLAAAVMTPYVRGSSLSAYESIVRFVIGFGAVAMVFESLSVRCYAFTALFAGVILLFNPVFPVFGLSGNAPTLLATAVLFSASLVRMKRSFR